jgi:hypothetical protein
MADEFVNHSASGTCRSKPPCDAMTCLLMAKVAWLQQIHCRRNELLCTTAAASTPGGRRLRCSPGELEEVGPGKRFHSKAGGDGSPTAGGQREAP